MTPARLSSLLNAQAETVCRYLMPNGKRVGKDWVAGDVYGGEGESFKVAIEGDKTGVGADFAGNETCGDLLDLWCLNQSVGLAEAMARACSFMNIVVDGEETKPKKQFKRPERPKLVRRLDREGKVYAYLRSRGMTDQVLEDFKISEQDGQWIVFPFLRGGEHINTKYIHIDRNDGKKQCRQEVGAEPCLFGWHALDQRFGNIRKVVITEGEIDCMTWHQCGIAALSIPAGAKNHDWVEADYDHLTRFDTFYINMDNDEAGLKAEAEIVKRLGAERCKLIRLPHKDANECFTKGIKNFAQFILGAKSHDPSELKSADYFTDDVMSEFYPKPGTFAGMKSPWKGLNESLRFNHQELIVWTGYSGSGKSMLLNQVAVQGMLDGEKFCIASFEMSPKKTLSRMVRQIVGERLPSPEEVNRVMKWLSDKCWIFNVKGTAKKERMLEVFKYAMRRYDIRQFIVDSFTKCGIDDDDKANTKLFIEQLCDFADVCDSTIHLVAHQRKPLDESTKPGKSGVRGSGVITDEAHTVIGVWRHTETESKYPSKQKKEVTPDYEKPDTVIRILKNREEGIESEHHLYFDVDSLQFHEQRQAPIAYLHQQTTDTF